VNNSVVELIHKIYDCVAGPTPAAWQSFLEAFVEAIGAARGALLLKPPGSPEGFGAACWAGWSDDEVGTYLSQYGAEDPWSVYAARQAEGSVHAVFEYCPREVMEASAAFREFYAPHDCLHGIGGIILVSEAGQTVIAAVRGRAAGPFGEAEKALLQSLMPHLRRAVLLYGEVLSLRRQLETFTEHLNRYPHAVLLADGDGMIQFANAAARELAARQDGIRVDGKRLSLESREHDRLLREAIGQMAAGRGSRLLRIAAPARSRPQPYRIILTPAADSAAIPLGGNMPAVTLMVVDPDLELEPDREALCEQFSLTPAEARVGCKLAIGWSVDEIASDSGTSPETVRTHVKRLLAKTGTVRQGELISLVWRSVPVRRA
jgi:DNA-binding CsgD family transcriptional regulator/PAS domain-containing protein